MANGTTETGGSWTSTDSLLKIGVGLLAGALAAYAIFELTSTSEEPPIRVKNGSLELELLTSVNSWQKDGNNSNWKLKFGTRTNDGYQVLALKASATCQGGANTSGNPVRITYSDNAWVEVRSAGKHTKVRSSMDLVQPADPRLAHVDTGGAAGYIQTIEVGQKVVCTFTGPNDLLYVLLTD